MILLFYGVVEVMKNYNRIKNITIEYYKVYTYEESQNNKNTITEKELEVSPLLEKLQQLNKKQKNIYSKEGYIALHSIKYNQKTNLWELVFFKERDNFAPFILDKKNGNVRNLILKNDEMISEILCVEYNPKINVFAIQRNIYAFGKKSLENFFASNLNVNFILRPIGKLNKETEKILKKGVVKKFKLHIKNVADKNGEISTPPRYNKHTALCNVINSAMSINSQIINIEFSVGKSSKKIAIQDDDFEVFDDLMENNNVKSLELGIAPDENSTMQITDFIKFRVRDIISIPIIKGQTIEIPKLLEAITKKFKENMYLKDEINEKI